jgi:hypothetical protein
MWPRLINTVLGIWLMAAPAVLGYEGTRAADHDRIVGPVLATFACVAIWEATRPLRWVNLLLGIWLVAAPWLIGSPTTATLNGVVVGIVVAALSLVRGRTTHSFGGGWTALWRQASPGG